MHSASAGKDKDEMRGFFAALRMTSKDKDKDKDTGKGNGKGKGKD